MTFQSELCKYVVYIVILKTNQPNIPEPHFQVKHLLSICLKDLNHHPSPKQTKYCLKLHGHI